MTTAQALSALHVPHNHSLFGLYRHFWDHEFLERKPPSRAERKLILNAIAPLLNDDGNSIALRSSTEIFTKLLREELIEKDLDIDRLGPWLIKLAGWMRHHGTANENEHQQLIQILRAMPQLRAALLRWQLKNWPKGKDFNPWWHFPFYDNITTDDDVPALIEMCHEYSGTPEIGAHIFETLFGITYRSPQTIKLEVIEELARTDSAYGVFWAENRVCALDAPVARMSREHQEFKMERANQEAEDISYVQSNIEALRTGNINFILYVIHRTNMEVFGDAPIEAIKERYGADVAQAVHEGLVTVWNNLKDIPALWPYSNALPNLAIAAGFGYRLQQPQLSALNQCQIDYLIWRMLKDSNETSTLLPALWEHDHSVVWVRVMDSIKRESTSSEELHPMVWQCLNSLEDLPGGLMDELVNYVVKEGIPLQARARQYALKILLRSSRRNEVLNLVSDLVNSEWCGQTLPAPWVEYAALSTLAAWWLLDADSAFDVLAKVVFQGARHSPRAIGFINGLQELQNNYSSFNSTWTEAVSWQNYAKLFPLLYAQPPCAEGRLGGGLVTPSDQFAHARDSLVNHISKAPSQLARAWFGAWKEDARFGIHRDWFANIYTELVQRQADESWSPLPIETVNQVLGGQASLARNENDVMLLLDELIEQELIPAFRSDYSMVSLLYSGTKKAGRVHLDEKALQTAILGQMMPTVRARHIIGAREPEVFDAKKPDARLSCILDSGAIVDIPVEVKWADHAELWTAIETQLLKKYMQDSRVRYGIYLVGWIGPANTTGVATGEKPSTPVLLQSQLQTIADQSLTGTDKKISVYVLDASLHD